MLKDNYCGLTIMRMQPMHIGHISLLERMIEECHVPILAIGSAQESRTYGNPFSYNERLNMVRNYPGLEKLKIVPIKDIFNLGAWARYALNTVEKKFKTKVNVYYCGADQDGALFLKEGIRVALVERKYTYGGGGKMNALSATRIRNWILAGVEDWKSFVPTPNHKMIERVYRNEGPKE
jgi:nicotinamide-nucleotide adenylyltransferase